MIMGIMINRILIGYPANYTCLKSDGRSERVIIY